MDENIPQPPQPPPPGAQQQFAQQPCPKCQAIMAVRIPHISVFNSIAVSIVAVSHEKFDKCLSCGALFVPQVMGVQPDGKMVFTLNELEAKEPTLVAGTQSNMAKALSLDSVTKGIRKQ